MKSFVASMRTATISQIFLRSLRLVSILDNHLS
jgi:hypothetical protein